MQAFSPCVFIVGLLEGLDFIMKTRQIIISLAVIDNPKNRTNVLFRQIHAKKVIELAERAESVFEMLSSLRELFCLVCPLDFPMLLNEVPVMEMC